MKATIRPDNRIENGEMLTVTNDDGTEEDIAHWHYTEPNHRGEKHTHLRHRQQDNGTVMVTCIDCLLEEAEQ